MEHQTGHSRLSIPRYNLSLLFCIPNIILLSYTVVEISLTKNIGRKKNGLIKGRMNRRMPVLNPTIQLVVVYLYTKYEHFILNGYGEIFEKHVLRNYKRMD